MDPELFFILLFVVIVVSIVANTIKEVAKRGIALKERQIELKQAAPKAAMSSEVSARLDQMEQRLRVLERIATDRTALPGADLAREIEALRHADPVPLDERAGTAI